MVILSLAVTEGSSGRILLEGYFSVPVDRLEIIDRSGSSGS
jgi:hypothetical protein